VEGFGEEWSRYDQRGADDAELQEAWSRYFAIFPWHMLPPDAVGFDLGCGSGRWARLVAPRIGTLHCIDASHKALEVARRNLRSLSNCEFHEASVDQIPLADGSMDFGYSLGVLHHVPDTEAGIRACVEKLKPGAPLLLYLYYAFDNRPAWFRAMWRASDLVRERISRLPTRAKILTTQLIAATVYYPLARTSAVAERMGLDVSAFPLSFYRRHSFYTMRTDALDRFGTRLEQRFTAAQIRSMMERAGLVDVRFHEEEPFWCAVGFRTGAASPQG
jgi:ubiquinone/menaquinone biosynthesis C-methylase UbiE